MKKYFICLIILFLPLFVFGQTIDVHRLASINQAVASVGATQRKLIISNVQTLTANLTIPATLELEIVKGGSITKASTYTLTINGNFSAGRYQVFSGFNAGDVTFGTIKDVYPEWWGIDGTADDVEINCAIASLVNASYDGGTVYLVGTAYATSGSIAMRSGISVLGLGRTSTIITYSGNGSAITLTNVDVNIYGTELSRVTIITTDLAANAIRIIAPFRRAILRDLDVVGVDSTAHTGTGILLDASGGGWIGGVEIANCYILLYKYGIYFKGGLTSDDQISMVSMKDVWLIGRSSGITSGSAGIYMNSTCSGSGTHGTSLLIESWETGIKHKTGTYSMGGFFQGAFEVNTVEDSVGISFAGEIINHTAYKFLRKGGASDGNVYYQEKHQAGALTRESRNDQKYVIYYGGGQKEEFGFYRGNSIIDGNNPDPKFIVMTGGENDTYSHNNYMQLMKHKQTNDNAVPTSGSWRIGDIIWNNSPVVGDFSGWVCTHSGTFTNATDNTGDTDGSTGVITGMTDVSDFAVGEYVDVSAGFPTTGPYEVLAVTATTMTIDATSNSAQVNITVDTSDPTFAEFGNINLRGSVTWDPGSLIDGAGETSSSITVTGSDLGDFVLVSAPYDLQDCTVTGYVQTTNTVEIRLQNESGNTRDLASGTWRVKVIKY